MAMELFYCADAGRTAKAQELIAASKSINLEHKELNGRTALIAAAENGHEAMVSLLLSAGAKTDAANIHGWTALSLATHNRHAEVLKMLVRAGADVKMQDSDGRTALDLARLRGFDELVTLLSNPTALLASS